METFDVMGQRVGIIRQEGRWRSVLMGPEGEYREASWIVPRWVRPSELTDFLAGIFLPDSPSGRVDVIPLSSGIEPSVH